MIDLRTSEVAAHDSSVHDTLAVAVGEYRPDDVEHLDSVLHDRLAHNLSVEDYKALIEFWGLGLTGLAQQYTAILWLYGESGSGKGHVVNLTHSAFGRLAAFVKLSTFLGVRSDIDADMADVLERDPRFVTCDEMGGSPDVAKLNALTGNTPWSARRPFGKPISRTLKALWIFPCVMAPSMNVETGLRRRSRALGFERRFEGKPNENFTAEELAAVVTLSIREAKRVYEDGYTPPEGNERRRAMLLESADPVSAWLMDLSDDIDGQALKSLAQQYNDDMDLDERERGRLTAAKLKARLKSHPRWTSMRGNGHAKDRKLRIKLKLLCDHKFVDDVNGAAMGAACMTCGVEESIA